MPLRNHKNEKNKLFWFLLSEAIFHCYYQWSPCPFQLTSFRSSTVTWSFLLKSCPEDIVLGNTVSRHLISLVAEHLLQNCQKIPSYPQDIYTENYFYVISKILKLGQADYFCLGSYRQFTMFAYSTLQFWANPRCLDKNCDSVKQQSSSTLVKLWACFLGITYA